MNLKRSLKEDIWRIIEKKDPQEKNWFLISLYLMLNQQKIKLKDVKKLSEKLKNAYDDVLHNTEEYIVENYGEVLHILNNAGKDYNNKIKPIIEEIISMGVTTET